MSGLMLDSGSEEHVCGSHISGNVINNFGTSTVDMKLGGPDAEASCRVALQVDAARGCCDGSTSARDLGS